MCHFEIFEGNWGLMLVAFSQIQAVCIHNLPCMVNNGLLAFAQKTKWHCNSLLPAFFWGDWALWEGSELNTQHRASYRNPGGRAPGWDPRVPCDGARTKARQPSEQNKSGSTFGGGEGLWLPASSDLTSLRKSLKGHAQRHFSPRKPSICTWRSGARFSFDPPPSGCLFFLRAVRLNETKFVNKMPRPFGGPRWKLHPSW